VEQRGSTGWRQRLQRYPRYARREIQLLMHRR
jgi:hypothetical protein